MRAAGPALPSVRWGLTALAAALLAVCGVSAADEATANDGGTPAQQTATTPAPASPSEASPAARADTRNGLSIYQQFRDGLADASCGPEVSPRWREHFSNAPRRLAAQDDNTLALFGYVVDAVREADLPTEYALIPFVESGYRPDAVSPQGPAGLWQMIKLTARNHHVPMHGSYDGRLSPVDSTQAAVRYLKTLHGMFAGDWRLAAMAYNAGEYRILGALKRSGQVARDARPAELAGVPQVSQAYVRKLRALACVLEEADKRTPWLQAMDRAVPHLHAVEVPAGTHLVRNWAQRHGHDAERIARLNPAHRGGRIQHSNTRPARLLAPSLAGTGATVADSRALVANPAGQARHADTPAVTMADASPPVDKRGGEAAPRKHTVKSGENAWSIARRYGIGLNALLSRNGLEPRSVLRPGRVLQIDPDPAAAAGSR